MTDFTGFDFCCCGGECPCAVSDSFLTDTIADYELTPETADFTIGGGVLSSTLDGRATQSLDLPLGTNVIGVQAVLINNSHTSFGLWIGDGTRNIQWLWQPGSNDCRLIVTDGATPIDQTYPGDPTSTLKVTLGGNEGNWTVKVYRDGTLVATHAAVAVTFDAYRVACGVTSTGGGTWDDLCLISCDAACEEITCGTEADHETGTSPFHRILTSCGYDCVEFLITIPDLTGPDGCVGFGNQTFRIWAKENTADSVYGHLWPRCSTDPGVWVPVRPLQEGPFGTESPSDPESKYVRLSWSFASAADPTRLTIDIQVLYASMPDEGGGINSCILRWNRTLDCHDPEHACRQLFDGIELPPFSESLDTTYCCGQTPASAPALFQVSPRSDCPSPPPDTNACCPDLLPDLSITYVTSGGATVTILDPLVDDTGGLWTWPVVVTFTMGGSECRFQVSLECVPSQPGVGSTRFKISVGDDIYEIEDFGSCESFLIEQDHVTDDVCPSRPGTMTMTITG